MPSLFPDPATPTQSTNQSTTWVTAHCDGGARGNPGPAGFGALLQDDAGHTLAQLSEFLGNRTNNFAEYAGLLGCLQWALDNGYRNLRVTSDSELMVKQIQGRYKVNSPDLRPLWEEARRRIARLDNFQITHALRHKNKAADQLANDAMDRGTGNAARGTGKPVSGRPVSNGTAPISLQTAPNPLQTASNPPQPAPKPTPTMLRGFTRDGAIHLLGGANLPNGIFVKVIPE